MIDDMKGCGAEGGTWGSSPARCQRPRERPVELGAPTDHQGYLIAIHCHLGRRALGGGTGLARHGSLPVHCLAHLGCVLAVGQFRLFRTF